MIGGLAKALINDSRDHFCKTELLASILVSIEK